MPSLRTGNFLLLLEILVCENTLVNLEGNMIVLCFFQGAELAGRAATAMSASDTQAVSMVPASSPGSVTARKAGGAFSATRVSPSGAL